jgi:hypothetical protein
MWHSESALAELYEKASDFCIREARVRIKTIDGRWICGIIFDVNKNQFVVNNVDALRRHTVKFSEVLNADAIQEIIQSEVNGNGRT